MNRSCYFEQSDLPTEIQLFENQTYRYFFLNFALGTASSVLSAAFILQSHHLVLGY